ncbi:MAG: sulfotransferase [Rubrobacter sp.]|nr:sulfotransferase [Rubrobacter sp.]MDQ3361426.1 sulfotransferase [Actinomycetota bacterium]
MRGHVGLSAAGASLRRLLGGLDLARGDHTETVFLAGSGRSGTTWLSGLVNHDSGYRQVFEPFHPGKVEDFRGFGSKQYLRPGDRREEFLEPARKAVTGQLRSGWTDRGGALVARRRLVKDIRANLLLGWLAENFPGMPIVLLMRHPCAVVSSRLALGWRDNLDEAMGQGDLVEDHLLPVEERIRAARDPFERHLFLWCIDNHVPLRQFSPGAIHLCFYENLVLDPEPELRRLFAFVGRDFDDGVLGKLGRPSFTSRWGERPSVDGWRSRVSGERLEGAVEVLGLFGLDRVYGAGPMPDTAGALDLMGAETRG